MMKSLPTCSIPPLLPACLDSECDSLGLYISDAPVGVVQRVSVRRRAIRIPDGRLAAAIRLYRENADLS